MVEVVARINTYRKSLGMEKLYLIADDTQLVQKFETLWGAEYAYGTTIYLPQIM